MWTQTLCTVLTLSLSFAGVDLARASAPPADTAPSAVPDPVDEVQLKSGGFVRGKIIEYMPGEYVVILSADRSETRRFEWAEVDNVVREGDVRPAIPQSVPGAVPGGVPGAVPGGVPGAVPGGVPGAALVTTSAPETTAPPAPALSPATPAIHIEQLGGKNPAVLYRIEGEGFGQAPGITIHTIHYREICEAPCDRRLQQKGSEFFVGGKGYGNSKRFRLAGNDSAYTLQVKPRSKGLLWGGYAIFAAGLIAGTALLVTPVLIATSRRDDALDGPVYQTPKRTKTAYTVGGVAVYAAGLAGGITLLLFSRSKVDVLPGRR